MKRTAASIATPAQVVAGRAAASAAEYCHAAHSQISHVLTSEISRLFNLGYSLIPLAGSDGKKPIVSFKDKKRLPLSLVVERMGAAGSGTYGILLDGLVVVDIDTDTPEAQAYVERRFGYSPCRTRTGRGFHLYFRSNGTVPKQVRLPGVAIDFKSGANAFVVGPQSERPDRAIYWPERRLLAPELLPVVEDREPPAEGEPAETPARSELSGRYPQGVRWTAIRKEGWRLAQGSSQFSELVDGLKAFRDREVEHPEHFTDSDLAGLAQWFWERKERGELWGKDNSVVRVPRAAITALGAQGHTVALTLYALLLSAHGSRPSDKPFAIVPDGLRKASLKAGRQQIYAAINVLVGLGLLERTSRGGKGLPAQYKLVSKFTGGRERKERSALTSVPAPSTS